MAERVSGWQRVLSAHPMANQEAGFWEEYLAEHPDVLNRLLHDIYVATYGAERPPTLDDLWAIMETPRFSTEVFGPAVTELLGTRSIRWLARETGVAQPMLSRYISGARPIVNIHDTKGSMSRLATVAQALRVHPSYFVEWRRLWIMSLIDAAFSEKPALSIGLFRRFSGLEEKR